MGKFTPLFEFGTKRFMQWESEEDLVRQIYRKYPAYSVEYDENDILGVNIRHEEGGEYNYEVGVHDEKKFRKYVLGEDKATALERHAANCDRAAQEEFERKVPPPLDDSVDEFAEEQEQDEGDADLEDDGLDLFSEAAPSAVSRYGESQTFSLGAASESPSCTPQKEYYNLKLFFYH